MVALCKKQRPGEWIYSLWFVIVLYFWISFVLL
jgi:hypothetical protein